ncbi:hypothetical protein ACGF8B_37475 [Streptomyces sp. NPDC047917]|uniref:hypothetical protein n=1 Tax=Streptomyces sp. NPDC047917 TaxID=3365491 RepID=UPI0037110D61
MTPDPTTRTRTATPGSAPGSTPDSLSGSGSGSTPGSGSGSGPGSTLGSLPGSGPGTVGARKASARGGFASGTVPRHLARGVAGFGALAGSLALLPVVGPASLLLAPAGLVALRGCPMCWVIGLAETVSAGRLRRSCTEGRCELNRAGSHGPAHD